MYDFFLSLLRVQARVLTGLLMGQLAQGSIFQTLEYEQLKFQKAGQEFGCL